MTKPPLSLPTLLHCLVVSAACSAEDPDLVSGTAGSDASTTGSFEATGDEASTAQSTSRGADGDASTSGEGDGSTAADVSSGESGDESEGPDPYRGQWCGNESTGRLELPSLARTVPMAGSRDGPHAFAGWVTDANEIQVAVYDVATATWGAIEAVATEPSALPAANRAAGAANRVGDAMIVHVNTGTPARIHAYRAATGSWSSTELAGTFVSARAGTVHMAPTGHAIATVYDNVGPVQETAVTAWFFDPQADAWSAPLTGNSVDQGFSSDTMQVAQDDETGDAVLAQAQDSGVILAHNHEASGDTVTTELPGPGRAAGLVSMGAGRFMLLARVGGFQANTEVFAHYYDGAQWHEPESIASGFDLSVARLVGHADGRAVASWQDAAAGTYVRVFGPDGSWQPPAQANVGMTTGWWSDHRAVVDAQGAMVAWSGISDGAIRTAARFFDGAAWDTATELDPQQGTPYSRIEALHSLGVRRARAIWFRDDDFSTQYAYACHAPMSGWSAATVVPERLRHMEPRAGGDILVMGLVPGRGGFAEYWQAQ